MRSLRTRITLMTVCVLILTLIFITVLTTVFIRKTEHSKSDQLLLLLCETGEKNLDYYFNSVQKSVRKVASFVEADLDGLEDEQLARHMDRVSAYFDMMASKTNGVLTYYYRIDPEISQTVKGFWFTDLTGDGFEEHGVTDITLYDTADTSRLVWFTVPKY
ncbi:MAG: sensor domain-containing diguanylate cyclase, partial [Clostridia bacterium]|nr:sensor domain-containing diguanylate cyclase [Clostridia bacterium]